MNHNKLDLSHKEFDLKLQKIVFFSQFKPHKTGFGKDHANKNLNIHIISQDLPSGKLT